MPSTSNFRNIKSKGHAFENQDTKEISSQGVQYRRNHGLCFKYGEKYGLGHQRKVGHLNFMICEKEEDSIFEDALGEQNEQMRNPGQIMEMSVHTLFEALKRKTITLMRSLDGEEVLILVDKVAQIVILAVNY